MNPPVLTQVWLATQEHELRDPLGAVWMRPQDYRDATAGSAFDVSRPVKGVYRRRPEREAMVERAVKRTPLF